MSTRSTIALALPDGRFRSVYCHFDGYPEEPGVGWTLRDHWTDFDKVSALMDLGDISTLGEEIGEKHPFDLQPVGAGYDHGAYERHEAAYGKMFRAYGRDRGEGRCSARDHDTFAELAGEPDRYGTSYLYLYLDGTWLFTASWPEGRDLTIDDLAVLGEADVDPPGEVP